MFKKAKIWINQKGVIDFLRKKNITFFVIFLLFLAQKIFLIDYENTVVDI
jgi:hypothetical protein